MQKFRDGRLVVVAIREQRGGGARLLKTAVVEGVPRGVLVEQLRSGARQVFNRLGGSGG